MERGTSPNCLHKRKLPIQGNLAIVSHEPVIIHSHTSVCNNLKGISCRVKT